MTRTPSDAAEAVADVFRGVFDQLAEWRGPIRSLLGAGGEVRAQTLDTMVADLVIPSPHGSTCRLAATPSTSETSARSSGTASPQPPGMRTSPGPTSTISARATTS